MSKSAIVEKSMAQGSEPKQKTTQKSNTLKYAVIIIAVLAVAVVVLYSVLSPILSKSPLSGPNGKSANTTCPCVNAQQVQQFMNESSAVAANAIANSTYISASDIQTQLEATSSNASLQNTALYEFYKNVSQGWLFEYDAATGGNPSILNASATNSSNIAIELILQSSSPKAMYDYEVSKENTTSNVKSGQLGSFIYSYVNDTLQNSTIVSILGYKNDYVVALEMMYKTNKGAYSPQQMVSVLNSTLP